MAQDRFQTPPGPQRGYTNPKITKGTWITGPIKRDFKRADAVASLKTTGRRLSTRNQAIEASTIPTKSTAKKQPRIKYVLKFVIRFASFLSVLLRVV